MNSIFFKSLTLLVFCSLFACVDNEPFRFRNGDPIPPLIVQDVNKNKVDIKSIKDKIILIDFWASWCGPCREKRPELINIYNEYKDVLFHNEKGFEIMSISMDKDKDKWLKAIEKDKLPWDIQLNDLKGMKKSILPNQFKFEKLPTSFLVNSDGKIIGVNLSMARLAFELKMQSSP